MNESKSNILGIMILIVVLLFLVVNSTKLIKKSTEYFVVENGSLSYEESACGYIIRDEQVVKGENYKNGMVQIKPEGERVSSGEAVFRYYSIGEEELNNEIAQLDIKINNALEESGTNLLNVDVLNLEKQIQNVLDDLYGVNDLEKQTEYLKKIDSYITKKTTIAGEQSPAGSYVKELINQRNELKEKLNENSEIVSTDRAGIISYRVDGFEEILSASDFSNLNVGLLESLDIDVGTTIAQNSECGKVYNNFWCYIACPLSSEKASEAKIGDTVTLKFSNSTQVPAEITYIASENDSKVIVFKIKKDIEKLIEYRKLSLEIVWWNYSGWKISNKAIKEEKDLSYVYRKKAGYIEKVLVKVLRQNDTYSIVTNYTKDELAALGFSNEEIDNMSEIKVYDEIQISK